MRSEDISQHSPAYSLWLGLLNRLLVFIMAVCLSFGLQSASRIYFEGAYLQFLALVGAFIAFEALFSLARMHANERPAVSFEKTWLVEWILLVVFLKLTTYLGSDIESLWVDARRWFSDPGTFIAEEKLIVAVLNGGLVWLFCTLMGSNLHKIESDDRMIRRANREGISSDRDEIRQRLLNQFTLFGLILVGFVVAARISEFGFDPGQVQLIHPASIALILFFCAGMLLMSQMQFSVLLAGWLWERIPFDIQILGRWILTSLIILVVVSFLAFRLPSEPVLGLVPSLRFLMDWIVVIFSGLLFILVLPLAALVSLINLLFRVEIVKAPEAVLPALPTVPPVTEGGLPSWFELVKSIGIWLILIGLLIYAAVQYLRQNREVLGKIRRLGFVRWFGQIWQHIRLTLNSSGKVLAQKVLQGLKRLGILSPGDPAKDRWRYLHLSALSPRQKIRFYYLAMVRRSNEAGMARQPAQSPQEFAKSLEVSFPEVEREVETITTGFIEARYSEHEISLAQSQSVKKASQVIREKIPRMDRRKKENE